MRRRLLNFFRSRRLEEDIREEIAFHRERSAGAFGNAGLIADRMRDASTFGWLETVWHDLRYALRQLAKAPVLLAVAVISLALGIGANTAIFTLIHAVMLQSLPVRGPEQLVLFNDDISTGTYDGDNLPDDLFSYASFLYLRAHDDSFTDLCAFKQGSDRVVMHVRGTPETRQEYVPVHMVSGNYFHVFGVDAAAGRLLRNTDDAVTAIPAVVMSYGFWKNRFHLDPAVLGQSVVLNGTAFTIAGIADERFFGERIGEKPDFWAPLSFQPRILKSDSWLDRRDMYWLNFMGRLKAGVTRKAAQSDMNVRLREFYSAQLGAHPTSDERKKLANVHIELKAGGGGISGVRSVYSKPLDVLMAVVGLVLLIACANLAALLLARATARRTEFLCRLALGASRIRLMRQVLTESVLLALIGGCAGALFAWWCVKMLILLLHIHSLVKVSPDPAVLAFTLGLSIVTGLLFGIIPAWKLSTLDPRPGNAATVNWGTRRFGSTQMLIALQVALSMVLLLGAGLLTHSLLALERQNIGFVRDHVLLMQTDADLAGYATSQYEALYRELQERMSGLAGVQAAALVRFSPESGSLSKGNFSLMDYTAAPGKKLDVADLPVGPGFFKAMGIPLRLGRTIDQRDSAASTPVAVVNETFVNDYLSGKNPLGMQMNLGSPFKAPGAEIVGVVADSKYYDLREKPLPMVFFPISQRPVAGFQLVMRTAADPDGIAKEARQMLSQVNSRLPVLKVTTLDRQVEQSLEQQKMITGLCSIFGLLALLLASIGIYGSLAYAVAGRTAEIGIRMAIGAQRRDVIWLMVRDLLVLLGAGLAAGVPFGVGSSHWLKNFLFGVGALDPAALASAAGLIVAIALLAGYLPARRAARIDPMRALRCE